MENIKSCLNCIFNPTATDFMSGAICRCVKHNTNLTVPNRTTCSDLKRKDLPQIDCVDFHEEHSKTYRYAEGVQYIKQFSSRAKTTPKNLTELEAIGEPFPNQYFYYQGDVASAGYSVIFEEEIIKSLWQRDILENPLKSGVYLLSQSCLLRDYMLDISNRESSVPLMRFFLMYFKDSLNINNEAYCFESLPILSVLMSVENRTPKNYIIESDHNSKRQELILIALNAVVEFGFLWNQDEIKDIDEEIFMALDTTWERLKNATELFLEKSLRVVNKIYFG